MNGRNLKKKRKTTQAWKSATWRSLRQATAARAPRTTLQSSSRVTIPATTLRKRWGRGNGSTWKRWRKSNSNRNNRPRNPSPWCSKPRRPLLALMFRRAWGTSRFSSRCSRAGWDRRWRRIFITRSISRLWAVQSRREGEDCWNVVGFGIIFAVSGTRAKARSR